MKGKVKNIVIALVIVAILLVPIIADYVKNKGVEIIAYDRYSELLNSGKFSLIYYGNTESDDFANISETLLEMKNEYDIDVKAVNFDKLNEDEKSEMFILNDKIEAESGLLFIDLGTTKYIHEGDISNNDLKVLIEKYSKSIIPEDEILYKIAKNATDYKKIINSKNVVMSVFGTTTCGWCNNFKVVYNDLANEYKLNIYNFDSDTYNETEYNKIMKLGLKVPKQCTQTGEAQLLSEISSTPLTIFTKKGKVIDCISGYLPTQSLEAKLKSVGMIK